MHADAADRLNGSAGGPRPAPAQHDRDAGTTGRTPGQELVDAVSRADGEGDVTVSVGVHLPAAFPLFASRPRYAVRHLLRTRPVGATPAPFIFEPSPKAEAEAGTNYESTPESGFVARLDEAELTCLPVSVPVPDGLLDHPDLFADFVDHRVLVRVSVKENQTLLHGSRDGTVTGLLQLYGLRRRRTAAALGDAVTDCAWRVEETGGSCDGIVAHPAVYWQMVNTGLLARLQTAGITVARTRMIPRDVLLLGDFRAAATLLVPKTSTVALRRDLDGHAVVEACGQVGLAVHLPQHLVALTLDGSRG